MSCVSKQMENMLKNEHVKALKVKANFVRVLEDIQMVLMGDINPDGLPSECIH